MADAVGTKAAETEVEKREFADNASVRAAPPAIDPEVNRQLLRKIDWRLMPVLCVTYALQFWDKAMLGQAAVFGLREDLKLTHGSSFSWVSLILYFGHIAGMYPFSWLAQRYHPKRVCSSMTIVWAVIVLTTPACTTYSGILANRFFLGFVEAGISPVFMLVIALWYTHPEQVLRSSIWYSFSGGSNIISPLVNFGLAHISGGGRAPWQYMYFFAGGITLLWGIALIWIFPDVPQESKGFSAEEKQLLLERVRVNNAGSENTHVKLYQISEALMEYQFWGIFVLAILSCTGSAVVVQFASIVFNGMGFDRYTSLLLNLPTGGMAFLCVIGSGYCGRNFKNARFHLITIGCLPVILGTSLVWQLTNEQRAGRVVGFYLINFFSWVWVQCIGLGTSNIAGHTKRTIYASGTFIGYSLGNVIGSLLFDAKFGPRYDQSFTGITVCFAVCCVLGQVIRFLLARENKRRDAKYGPPEWSHGLEDLTDRENKSFRYTL
ncbi:major facilitator superfamily domain-containing protein [Apiospora saccharicola]|uniref:Major facilitator superfamily domain-containing protein n=1 Tax=Apiospora saccharicola TaxID=335842 RepID=A0ABR1WK63_9PEZI